MSGTRTFDEAQRSATNDTFVIGGDKKLEAFLWKLLLLTALAYFVWSEQVSIQIGPLSIRKSAVQDQFDQRKTDLFSFMGFSSTPKFGVMLEDDTINNLTFAIDPTFAARHDIGSAEVQQRMRQSSIFIKKFSPVAVAEMRHFGIPASILLAQALLGSNAGEDETATETNNYFQRPCLSSQCNAAHHNDSSTLEEEIMIDVFPNLWGSFRAQSLFFKNTAPYSELIRHGKKDYRLWARTLSEEGYSNEEAYGEKLIAIIQTFQLDAFDRR